MNYIGVVMFILLPFYVADSLIAYIAYSLAGRKMPRRNFVLQIPAVLIQSTAYSVFAFINNLSGILIIYLGQTIFSIADIVIPLSWIYFLFRDTDKKTRFFYMSTVFPFYVFIGYTTNALIGVMTSWEYFAADFTDLEWSIYKIFINFASFFIVYASAAVAIRFISKTSFWSKLQAFGNYPKLYIPMGMFYFLLYSVVRTIIALFIPSPWGILGITLPYLVLFAVVVLMVSDLKKTENLNAAQNLLLQQQNYINKLESIQQEIRGIQHDYKNMLSGLYTQASEGNTEAVKEYIDTKLLKVDETVRKDLQQMNQLTKIEVPELKGLITTKILEAERDKVSFRLEVMFPVVKVPITTEDLLRCVGILLDNAIEEAKNQEDAAVTLLLLREDKALTVIVKNPVQEKPDLSRIWNEGYSTKGSGRGRGLSNYQNIVRKHPNATQETKIEGEHFVQLLVLAGEP